MAYSGIQSRRSVPVRPLGKGMYRDIAMTEIPDTGFWILNNYLPDVRGPKKRAGFSTFAVGTTFDYRPHDMLILWLTNGSQVIVTVTEGSLYKAYPDAPPTELVWETAYASNALTATTGSAVVTRAAGLSFQTTASYIQIGDIVRLGSEERRVSGVSSATSLTIESAFSVDHVGTVGSIVHSLPDSYTYPVDYVVYDSKLLYTYYNDQNDGGEIHPIMEYDPSIGTNGRIQPWLSNASYLIATNTPFSARTIAVAADRIYAGMTYDAIDKTRRYRILWSAAANTRNFSDNNYYELPYSAGAIVKLLPLDTNLVCYCTDAIYMGTITNDPNLPVRFQKLDTANFGLVGNKAIVSFFNAHYFVSQNGFYKLDRSGTFSPIGSSIDRYALANCGSPEAIVAAVDPANYRIVFGVPGADGSDKRISRVWSYDYRSSEWAFSDITTSMLAVPTVSATLTIGGLGTTAIGSVGSVFGGAADAPISALQYGYELPTLYIAQNSVILKQSASATTDNGSNISTELISKNYDFGEPDSTKTFLRLSTKVEWTAVNSSTVDLTYVAYGSVNSGRTWKFLGQLTIPAGYDEGYVDFRMTGSSFQFRLVGGTGVPQYTHTQFAVDARGLGAERSTDYQA